MGIKADIINSIFGQLTPIKAEISLTEEDIDNALTPIYAPGPSFYFIFNLKEKGIEYLSPKLHDVLGLDPRKASLHEVFEHLYDDDLIHFKKCQEIGDVFYNQIIDLKDAPHYKRSYQYRLTDIQGVPKLFLHQSVLVFNAKGEFTGKSIGFVSDISAFTAQRSDGISFIDNRGLRSFLNITSLEELHSKTKPIIELSDREIEILKLIAEGAKSKEIGNELNISYDTVRTHRNNILRRQGFKNISQALAYYLRQGAL